jgi:hypothetical protein
MAFDATTPLIVSVDVELVDPADPACPFPGEVLSISSEYELNVPGAGLYDIWIPLDSPVVVNGPFFAGFFISNLIDASINPAVVTDSTPVTCASWNIWDTNEGWADLGDNPYWNFPGRLVLYAAGVPGGTGGSGNEPLPEVAWVNPGVEDDVLYSPGELWAAETSGSTIIEYVSFEYNGGSGWVLIGNDYDGASPLRNGVDPAPSGNGFSMQFDFGGLAEGTYSLRATIYDTLGRSAEAITDIVLEPTPPVPRVVSPDHWTHFCSTVDFLIQCQDENTSYMQMLGRAIADNHNAHVYLVQQNLFGDADGDAGDGNSLLDGEYGDYYCGPAAATMALRFWWDRGYSSVMESSGSPMGMAAVAESLAVLFGTREFYGTTDERMYLGLSRWVADRAAPMSLAYMRNPDYVTLRQWAQADDRIVILGIGGSPGFYAVVNGFTGWQIGSDSFTVSIANPLTGMYENVTWRSSALGAEVYHDGSWHPLPMMISLVADDWTVNRTSLGVDIDASDGWSVSWTPGSLVEGDYFYMQAFTRDQTNYVGTHSVLMQYNCSSTYLAGDYNNDGQADIADLYYLVAFQTLGGTAPDGGAGRADANCDNYINIADIIYFMNFLFGSGSPPCY